MADSLLPSYAPGINNDSNILSLPWDLQANIFRRLDPRSRSLLREVCRTLRVTMDDPTFWRKQVVRLSWVRRFRSPMWNLLHHRNIKHVEVRPSVDETQEYHRHNMVWNEQEWEQLAENIPGLKSITTPLKCDKGQWEVKRQRYSVQQKIPTNCPFHDFGAITSAVWQGNLAKFYVMEPEQRPHIYGGPRPNAENTARQNVSQLFSKFFT